MHCLFLYELLRLLCTQFVSCILDSLEGKPTSFCEFDIPAGVGIKRDTLVAVTRVVISDAIASGIAEPLFRSKLGRAGIPDETISLLSVPLFARAPAVIERRLRRLPAVLGGRVLVSFDWKVQHTLASSSLDVQGVSSVMLCLRTRDRAALLPSQGGSDVVVDTRTDFIELNAAELDAVIGQLQSAVAAGAAISGSSVRA